MPEWETMAGIGRLLKDGNVLFCHVEVLNSASKRARGLLGRSSLQQNSAVLLAPCRAIHTFFMSFSIDVAFMDSELRVLRIARDVRPFKTLFGPMRAKATLEWQAGWLVPGAVAVGDCLSWEQT